MALIQVLGCALEQDQVKEPVLRAPNEDFDWLFVVPLGTLPEMLAALQREFGIGVLVLNRYVKPRRIVDRRVCRDNNPRFEIDAYQQRGIEVERIIEDRMKLVGTRAILYLKAAFVSWPVSSDARGRPEGIEDDSDPVLPRCLKNDPEGGEARIRPMENAAARLREALDEEIDKGLPV
jgi:hypothetical protein